MTEKTKHYTDYTSVLNGLFRERVQKISVNAGFTCPNRDGSKGVGGCTYCNNESFSPDYCQLQKPITTQILEGIAFFKYKYTKQKYLVYFQSYTNTYADFEKLKTIYEEALSVPNVVGMVIGTRPDCVSDELLDYFAMVAKTKYVMVEYGIESVYDDTLKLINRGHTFAEAQYAIEQTAKRGVYVGAHFILGLPNESREMILDSADFINKLPLNAIKLHQLQLIKGTVMAEQYHNHPEYFNFFVMEDYLELLIGFLEKLKPTIAIERFVSQSNKDLLIMPQWGLKNFEFVDVLEKRMRERNTFQGKLFS